MTSSADARIIKGGRVLRGHCTERSNRILLWCYSSRPGDWSHWRIRSWRRDRVTLVGVDQKKRDLFELFEGGSDQTTRQHTQGSVTQCMSNETMVSGAPTFIKAPVRNHPYDYDSHNTVFPMRNQKGRKTLRSVLQGRVAAFCCPGTLNTNFPRIIGNNSTSAT